MPQPKKVAIIGAGPSGLVAAKTLLHNYSQGLFIPTIFERNHAVGGLWSVTADEKDGSQPVHASRATQFVSPSMPTNLSRFSVSFSDLAWESVEGLGSGDLPMFPRAWQVGKYLEKYAELYVPREVLRLGCRVVRTLRQKIDGDNSGMKWIVEWVEDEREVQEKSNGNGYPKVDRNEKVSMESFDFLVVASGYFSRPYMPDIPGLANSRDRVIHSSALRDIDHFLSTTSSARGGKLVVVGGSMSGVEAASALALHLSSSAHSPGPSNQNWVGYTVHHVSSRPFWCVPTYLPKKSLENLQSTSFFPLDLVMYDLSRRPQGKIEYSIGPMTPERSAMINQYFESLLGTDQSNLGSGNLTLTTETDKTRPPWVAVSDSYAEYVRSREVNAIIGRVEAAHISPDLQNVELNIKLAAGTQLILDDVAAIVLATGFSPSDSLSLLPAEILSLLEYSSDDTFFPIILDNKGCIHSDIPDLGFVGLYRGPYWGVMEMQARILAQHWSSYASSESGQLLQNPSKGLEERQHLLELRQADPKQFRAQFPMGDYVGLMESFARDLGITRFELPNFEERSGPAIPARYALPCVSSEKTKIISETETTTSLDALQVVLSNKGIETESIAKAVFRALQGRWKFNKQFYPYYDRLDRNGNTAAVSTSGVATFHPRYPSNLEYSGEYLYEEHESKTNAPLSMVNSERPTRLVYRLRETAQISPSDRFSVWSVDRERNPNAAQRPLIYLEFEHLSFDSVIRAHAQSIPDPCLIACDFTIEANHKKDTYEYVYHFHMKGINITSWELLIYDCSLSEEKQKIDKGERDTPHPKRLRQLLSKRVYER